MSATGAARRRPRFQWGALAAAIAGLGISALLIAVLVAPALSASFGTEVSHETQVFPIPMAGGTDVVPVATVTPGAGWIIAPGDSGAVRLDSPDRQLEVLLRMVSEDWTEDAGNGIVDGFVAELWEGSAGDLSDAVRQRERLASGLDIEHMTIGEYFVGTLSLGPGAASDESSSEESRNEESRTEVLLIEARVDPPSTLDEYRATLAQLIESVQPA